MNLRYNKFFKLPRKTVKIFLSFIYSIVVKTLPLPRVLSIDETIDKILNGRCSICRFGDGEFLYIIDHLNLPFQRQDSILRNKLKDILISNEKDILIGLPVGYHSMENLTKKSRLTWRSQISWIYPRLYKYIDRDKIYYNASMTRLYADYEDKTICRHYFEKIMKIWEGRDVLIVEGEKSRLGVGNNLFEKAIKVERILAPMHDAFSKYSELIEEILTHDKIKLVLIALGPTATAMAYDVAKQGYQALDIGNIDIEYEWYLRKAEYKEKIPGKYTSEVPGGRQVEDIFNREYTDQIIKRIL
jgi:glycosyltransferase family protein